MEIFRENNCCYKELLFQKAGGKLKLSCLGKVIGSGAVSDVYEYGPGKVCKLYKTNPDSVEYEYHKMRQAYDAGIPVPRPYGLVRINHRRGFLMERVEGISFLESLISYLDSCFEQRIPHNQIFSSDFVQSQLRSSALTLAQIHSYPCPFQETAKMFLIRACSHSLYLSDQEKAMVQERISNLPDGDSLCHGDPNPGNFLQQGACIRLIDWNNSVKGNFLYDLAEYVVTMRYADVSLNWSEETSAFLQNYQNEFSRVFLENYATITGRNFSGIEDWIIPVLVSKLSDNNPPQKQEKLLYDLRQYLNT